MSNVYIKPSGVELSVNDESELVREYIKSLGWKKKPGPKPVDKSQEVVPVQLDSKSQ
jgi:hypothetical protein